MRAVAEELSRHTPDTARGYEIADDRIVLMVPPSRPHRRTALRIRHQVDPRKATLTVFTDPGAAPDGTRYRGQHDYAFGDDVALGPWTLEATGLRPYPPAR
ncbi:hypothetical protein [Streptomyces sp. NPDC020917]|uniref:hypothetical protein n=1 Tax=Streptomyces sp. NPDC020917 TaxID=3365102 RepID=UPI0037BB6FD0